MGGSISCLPATCNTFQNFRPRNSTSKFEYDVEEAFNKNKNALNINQVSEDELLFLPGIDRQIAVNIIQYRYVNNGFKKVDEVLKVSGINSNLFKRIANDITIDISSSSLSNKKAELVDINSAAYNELLSIPSLTATLVNRIIHRREKKGSFHFIEDLLKIKGIDYIILANIRPYITIRQNSIPTSISNYSLDNYQSLFHRQPSTDTLSLASLLLETLPVELQTLLLSSPPHRPLTIETDHRHIRFASWNLQELTNEKVHNPGVREVICRVILENNFSLIGIQEISSKEALDLIVQELNNPTIPLIKDWPDRHQGQWNFVVSDITEGEYLGFIYDESVGIEKKEISSLNPNPAFTHSPLFALFRINKKHDFVFVNIHLKSNEAKALANLAEAIENTIKQKHVVIFGSFGLTPTDPELAKLLEYGYSYVIEQNTDIDLKNPQGSTCHDNIWLSSKTKTETSGVIHDNLTSMWIPTGWTWGGLVSNHCPIYTELIFS